MKRIALLFLLLVFVSGTAWAQNKNGLVGRTYKNKDHFFSISLPKELAKEGWLIADKDVPNDTLVFIYLPNEKKNPKKDPKKSHSQSLMVWVNEGLRNPKETLINYLDFLKGKHKEFRRLSLIDKMIDGKPSCEATFAYRQIAQGIPDVRIKGAMVTVAANLKTYRLVGKGIAKPTTIDNHRKIAATFRLLPSPFSSETRGKLPLIWGNVKKSF